MSVSFYGGFTPGTMGGGGDTPGRGIKSIVEFLKEILNAI